MIAVTTPAVETVEELALAVQTQIYRVEALIAAARALLDDVGATPFDHPFTRESASNVSHADILLGLALREATDAGVIGTRMETMGFRERARSAVPS